MAGWLSSRLKAAEQLLHQIDQQAAVSLQKQEKQRKDSLTTNLQVAALQANQDQQLPNTKRPDILNLLPQGNGKSRHAKPTQPCPGTRRSSQEVPGPSKQQDFGKQDWAELLGSVDLTPPVSVARFSSSVGSTDFAGTQSGHNGGSQRISQYTGNGGTNVQPNNGIKPASRTLSAGAGPPRPSSPQASRTKVSASHMVDTRASELITNSDVYHDLRPYSSSISPSVSDASVQRCLHFGAPPFEEIEEHDSRRSQVEDAVSHTSNVGISEDLTSKHGESTELEVTVPNRVAYVDEAPKASVNDNICIEDVNVLLSECLMQPPTTVFDKHGENGQTVGVASEDPVLKIDGIEIERREDLAEVGVLEEDRRFSDARGGDVVNDHATGMEAEDPQLSVEITPEGDDRENSDGGSLDSDLSESEEESPSGSDSESDLEYEERVRRRRKRRQDQAEQRAAKAARAAIRERAEFVDKLEKEKEHLELLLVEGEEQQAKELVELSMTMDEVSQAVEVEKQQHSVTRREGLAWETQLEAKNQELSKALAAGERHLEDEMVRVSAARSKVEAKHIVHSELERRISSQRLRLRPPFQPQGESAADEKSEHDYIEEQTELATRLEQCQIKATELEGKIWRASDAHYTPSVMELEVETRLNSLTDHLIQKQAQVEALSTEKATLHFRLEAISNTLREEKSAVQSRATGGNNDRMATSDWAMYNDDLEYGLSKPYSAKDKNSLMGSDPDSFLKQSSGSPPFTQLVRQMDTVFLGGARILRTSGSARTLAGLYLLLLHGWVLFILFMHVHFGGQGKAAVETGINTSSSLTLSVNSTSHSLR